ncbi:hypothetical protein LWM68_41995 [Niabella sp. W65]|nr:hypothetical protein [Niabella sp. W65]MCH7368726.1 hypothetical protein [Niabella sp. W65]ULT44298.1 hypothetical protein KRR40_13675 [Niabella sp. I65]
MKKTILAIAILGSVVVACTPKASKTQAPPPVPETPAVVTGSVEAGGIIIASAKCTKCHGNKTEHVPKHTFAEQEKLMQGMAKKAKLSEQETADLMAYVKAKAKQ